MRFNRKKNSEFFEILAEMAKDLIKGTEYLEKIVHTDVSQEKQRNVLRNELHAFENAADDLSHQYVNLINQTFVTPIDRDDLSHLAFRLDDCMDRIDEAGNLIVIYKIAKLPEVVAEQVEILNECARLTAQAMPHLQTLENLKEYWVEINRLENQADQVYTRGLIAMFDEINDPIEIIKIKDVLKALEEACDSYETLAAMIEGIHLKES